MAVLDADGRFGRSFFLERGPDDRFRGPRAVREDGSILATSYLGRGEGLVESWVESWLAFHGSRTPPPDEEGGLGLLVPGQAAIAIAPALPYSHIEHMVIHMKTTLNIDATVMRRLRAEAVRRETTMSALVEAGLRLVLAGDRDAEEGPGTLPTLPSWHSGGHLVDISNREELHRVMEDD